MDAMLTVDDGRSYADIVIDLDSKVLSEVVVHFHELREGLAELTVCIDAHEAQMAGRVAIRVDVEGITRCKPPESSRKASCTTFLRSSPQGSP